MKEWFKFFYLSFFSNKRSKEAVKRSYSNFFLGLLLALAFLWLGFIASDIVPFGAHYNNSPDFKQTVRQVLANQDVNKRISAQVEDGTLKLSKHGQEYTKDLLINTFESQTDKQNYSVNGFNVVVDSRPADTLAQVEAYCVSNDGNNTVISYEEYLTLSDVASLNFDFKLKYTLNALVLDDAKIELYKAYIDGLSEDNRLIAQDLLNKLNENTITKAQYDRSIYELYFTNYYPSISAYESNSKVPLLRNAYYHNYVMQGTKDYLFIFEDYVAGAFKTKAGINVSFYGFYSKLENGALVLDTLTQDQANAVVDKFVKKTYSSTTFLNIYAHAVNVITLTPFIALMPMIVTLLAYSILKLGGVESVSTMGAMFKIVGTHQWFSGVISAVVTIILSFFVQPNLLSVLPLIVLFVALAVRSIIFAIAETKAHKKQLQQQESKQKEL